MGLSVTFEEGRTACVESIESFLRAADGVSEYDLLGASRCHGWSRLDVVVHTIGGWQEMLGGLVSPTGQDTTVDAASFWPAFVDEYDDDPLPALMGQRRRTAAYARPASALAQLRDVGAALLRGVASSPDQPCRWLGEIFTRGDYLTVWAVENVVHQLDLLTADPVPASGLTLARRTVEALIEAPLPREWTDEHATLVGTGRLPVPDGLGPVAARLPALR